MSGKEEVNRWTLYRHRYPYEQEEKANGIGLDFNFWQGNRYLTLEAVTDILESCAFPTSHKVPTLKPLPPIENTICLFLEDFDPNFYTEFADDLSFFSNCSSVPIVSAKVDIIKRELATINQTSVAPNLSINNAWFWNDVKHIPSLLFWPYHGLNFASASSLNASFIQFSALKLFRNHQITWQCQHERVSDALLFTPEKFDTESLALILEGAKLAFQMHKLADDPLYQHLFEENNEQTVFGTIYFRKNNWTGFYLGKVPLKPKAGEGDGGSQQGRDKVKDKIVIVLFWQTGMIDILYEVKPTTQEKPTEYTVDQSLRFRSVASSLSTTPEDLFELSLLSLRPLQYLTPIKPPTTVAANTTDTTEDIIVKEANPVQKEESNNNDQTSTPKKRISLSSLQEQYQQYAFAPTDYLPFLLSRELLEMMGYLLDGTYVQFLDSSDPYQWKYHSGVNPYLLPATTTGTSTAVGTTNRFAALEEGEEEEEEEEGEEREETEKASSSAVVIASLPPLLSKLQAESIALYPFEASMFQANGDLITNISNSAIFPLDLCAIDCEMCSTRDGLELTRITMLHPQHGIILDTFVKPKLPITDYHTEFSGVTPQSLEKITVTLQEIQHFLPLVISPQTILIGHSLDNDLKALRIIHHRIIDTGALYPHPLGIPHKLSLKALAKDYLHWEIQESATAGHDSVEDAMAALLLVFVQIHYWKKQLVPSQPSLSVSASVGHSLNHTVVRNDGLLAAIQAETPDNNNNNSNNLNNSSNVMEVTEEEAEKTVSKFTLLDYLLYRLPYRYPSGSSPPRVSFHGFSQSMYGDRSTWERMAFGYRKEGDLSYLLETFQSQLAATATSAVAEIETSHQICDSWSEVLVQIQEHLTTSVNNDSNSSSNNSNNSHRRVYFGSLNFQKEFDRELAFLRAKKAADQSYTITTTATAATEPSESNKRRRVDDHDNITIPTSQSIFERINEALDRFQQSLPPQTVILLFSQKDLREMRKLIAKKIRYKWDNAPYNPRAVVPTTTATTGSSETAPQSGDQTNTTATTTDKDKDKDKESTRNYKKTILKRPKVPIILKPGITTFNYGSYHQSSNNNHNNHSNKRAYSSNNNSGGGGGGNGSALGGGFVPGYDWEPTVDENRLIEETNRVAACSLFFKYIV